MSPSSADDLHIVYLSRLMPDLDHEVFGAVCRTARARNAEQDIAGVLLFDGQRFFQWLYGGAVEVSRLMSSIALDPRHTDLVICTETVLPVMPFRRTWRAGFVEPHAMDALSVARHSAGEGGHDDSLWPLVIRLMAAADLEPSLSPDVLATLTRLTDDAEFEAARAALPR